MKILIDNGHGADTKGKCSPDGLLREYRWAREIAARLEVELTARGYDAVRIVTEEQDVSLTERVGRINELCKEHGTGNCVLVSIHVNAAGADGKWHSARGWSGWVSSNSSTKSREFAQMLYDEAARRGLRGNRCVPNERYWIGNWAICRCSRCPAVLTENLFQDNREDVDFLLSEKGKEEIVKLHFDAIVKYVKKYGDGK